MQLIIIGAGPAGFETALLAAREGHSVTLIDKDGLGGVCLNRGCIPTKSYLSAAQRLHDVKNNADFGISNSAPVLDFAKTKARKEQVVDTLKKGVASALSDAGVRFILGEAVLTGLGNVRVNTADGAEDLSADYILLATGSEPIVPECFAYDGKQVLLSDDVLSLERLPESVIIAGGGVVGCEIGQFLSRFGVSVQIVEALNQLLPNEDSDISRQLSRQFKKEKIKVHTSARIVSVEKENGVRVTLDNGKVLCADKLLICIGRKPYTKNLNLERTAACMDERGYIQTDSNLQTGEPGLYAAGDIIKSPQLAHVAAYEGRIAYRNMTGSDEAVCYSRVPHCVYTDPEIAVVGLTEKDCKAAHIPYCTGSAPFRALGKAQAAGKLQGFVKIITDDKHKIIGAAIAGHNASDLLTELTLAIELGVSAGALSHIIHPHPSFSEAIMEAAKNVK